MDADAAIVRLAPFPPGAIAAIEAGNLSIASELTGVTFGEAWEGGDGWAHDYLAYLQRYQPLAGLFLVVHDGEAVGRVGWTQFVATSPYELSYVILPPWQRRGLATTAVRHLIKLLQLTRGVTLVTAVIKRENQASRGVLTKLGFRHTGGQDDNEFYELVLVE